MKRKQTIKTVIWTGSIAAGLGLGIFPSEAHAQIDFHWNDPNGGAFNNAGNWTSPFPGALPGLAVRTVFDLPNGYTVTFPANPAGGTISSVRRGNVTFDLLGNTYTLGDMFVGEFANNVAELTVKNGRLNPGNTTLGDVDPSVGTVIVREGGRFDPNLLRVGDHGTGSLLIQDGGRATAVAARLGNELSGHGTIHVSGTDAVGNRSTLTHTREITVGNQGHGEVRITNGALVQTSPDATLEQADTIGLFPAPGSGLGATGVVTIDGVAANGTPSTWTSTGPLRMGNIAGTAFAQGTMTITDGGQARHTEAVMLGSSQAPSQVEIRGTDAADNPSKWTLSSGGLDLSAGADVVVADGGAFEVDRGIVITQIEGLEASMTVTGTSANGVRSSYNGGGLTVGSLGDGELNVTNGAIVTAPGLTGSLQVGVNTNSDGAVLISGSDASDNPATMTMGRTLTLGNQGSASLTVSNGGVLNTGFDDPLSFGIVALRDSSSANVQITGEGSTWSHARNLFVGGGAASPGGNAEMTIADGATVNIGLMLKVWNTADVLLAGGTLNADVVDIADGGGFDFSSGVLSVNTFSGDLTNEDGVLSPGQSTGQTVISGLYQQLGGGTLAIEIAGLTQGTEHDRVTATTASLDGALDVALIDGFMPQLGDSFTILASNEITGQFSDYTGDVFAISSDLALVPVLEIDNPTNDGADVVKLIATAPGDANADGQVDVSDLGILGANFNLANRDWFSADFNGDGVTDISDLGILGANFSDPTGLEFSQALQVTNLSVATPEPGTVGLMAIGFASIASGRRRKQ